MVCFETTDSLFILNKKTNLFVPYIICWLCSFFLPHEFLVYFTLDCLFLWVISSSRVFLRVYYFSPYACDVCGCVVCGAVKNTPISLSVLLKRVHSEMWEQSSSLEPRR